MPKLIMWNLQTLDGYFEGAKPWDLDFHDAAWGDELQKFAQEQMSEVGAVLYGRATYEGMAAYWSKASGATAEFMNAVPKVVFSRTLKTADWNNTRLVNGEAADEVATLKKGTGRDLFVFGSAKLSDSLLRRGLFDELRICIAPVVLRNGMSLFKSGGPRQDMTLLESRALKSGGVILRYGMKAAAA